MAENSELIIDLHDGSQEQVSVIVVHKDRPEYLNICLQSIHIMSNLNNYEVIVSDNNSGKETQDYLDVIEQEGIKVVRNKENLYWSGAANRGVAVADKRSKYFLFLHCDTVVLNQAWIDIMVNISEMKTAGIVGHQLQEIVLDNQKLNYIAEWCVLMTRDCWNDCGPWAEELPLIGNAFLMTLKAQKKGYKPTATTNPLVHHYRATSFDPNMYSKMALEARSVIPRLIQQLA